jgi:uncharacterized phiE125 gp8 family phage protein
MAALVRLVAPPVTPLSLTEVKAHLRVDGTDQDDVIQLYLDAATAHVDGEWGCLGRALVTQTWRLTIDTFPCAEIKIPLPPLQSVSSVGYFDSAGDFQTMIEDTDYFVDDQSEPGWITPMTTWPTTLDAINSVRIDFVAGYEPTADSPPDYTANIPADIKQAMLLMITDWMENRRNVMPQSVNMIPFASAILLLRKKIDLGFA